MTHGLHTRSSWIAILAGSLLLAFAAAAPSAGAVSFWGPTHFDAGGGATVSTAMTVGDFDGDGNLDIVSGHSPSILTILLGDGQGGFGDPAAFPGGISPQSIGTGHFDDDGNLDLAVVNGGMSPGVSILLGDGEGGFSAPDQYPVGTMPRGVAVGDFNGDTFPDVAVGNLGSNDISVLLGDGEGGLGETASVPAGSGPSNLVAADLDDDGNLDLAVARGSSNQISILLGDGEGGFSEPASHPVGSPFTVATGDLDGDGNLDLVVPNTLSSSASVMLGDGEGGFAAATGFAAGWAPTDVGVGDFDGDSHLDLAVANSQDDNVSILLGDGTGGLAAPVDFDAEDTPRTLVPADLDGDSDLDLVVLNRFSASVTILLQQAEPTLIGQATAAAQLGGPISDLVTLAGGDDPTGVIAFAAYGPNDPTCSNEPAATSEVPVDGNGAYASAPFTPGGVGTFRWVASYSGDVANREVSAACDAPGRTSVITARGARLALKVQPRRVALRPGGASRRFTAVVRNSGDSPARNARVCVTAPRRFVRVRRCLRLGAIAPGQVKRARFAARLTRRARKGKRYVLRFRAMAAGVGTKRGVARLRAR